ncbi:MAG: OsmC family peroxiredoxin [Bacteroidota bacterium]|nr:OsmC family peroxiredoxin [Bacteroidota bacterium]MDP4232567.1 OsmC family peroxiredoxin [Bacteroidota bacterium]MDP4242979.1 OsmC family peroxiredoxin [Bacteroidota bacterium]MDP4286446.1 OsmC family peroxiredoxin [Bacteroidota bacterium]
MPSRTSTAQWNGTLKGGKGTMRSASGGAEYPFSFNSRMEGGQGSSPEELLASALAGCYSMALSADLEKAGFDPRQVKTSATANFSNASGKWTVDSMDLAVEASIPGIDDMKFQEIANGTKSACPVARALASVKINVNAKLVE